MIILVVSLFFLSEIAGYFWHRLGAHQDIIPGSLGVQESHKLHHTIMDDQAHGDFFYILIFLLLFLYFLIFLVYSKLITLKLALSLYLPVFLVSVWNWYVHAAYHIEGHWLERYDWFLKDRRIHFQHHLDPKTNYGIATHFSDIVFDTFDYGLMKI